MSSPRRISANRKNAVHSTGPKTAAGKRAVAGNALRHGLSVPASLEGSAPWVQEIEALLQQEITDQEQCHSIALCISQLERTLAAQQAVAIRQARGEQGYRDPQAMEAIRHEVLEASIIESIATEELKALKHKRGRSWAFKREEAKTYQGAGRLLGQIAKARAQTLDRQALADAWALRRYYKRATNQLRRAIEAACAGPWLYVARTFYKTNPNVLSSIYL